MTLNLPLIFSLPNRLHVNHRQHGTYAVLIWGSCPPVSPMESQLLAGYQAIYSIR